VREEGSARQADKLGISVLNISSEMASQLKLNSTARAGVMVSNVSPRGASWKALDQGDIILSVLYPTKRDVKSADDLNASLAPLKSNDVIELKVCRPTPAGTCLTRAVSVQIRR
jgi:S1-C subfamily serine protease